VLNASENVYQLGWVSVEEATSADWEISGDGEPPVGEDIWQELPLPPGVDSYGCDTGAAWSPHGDQLAITGLEYGPPCNVNGGLTIVDIDIGSAERLLEQPIATGEEAGSTVTAGAHTPAWSPDGEWIAVGLDQDADGVFDFPARLHIMRPDGSELIPLTDNSQGQAAYAVWSPDGILYYALSGAGAGRDGIYQFNPAAQTNSLVIKGSDLRPVSVSPDGQFLLYEQDNGLVLWGFLREETIHVTADAPGNPATFSGWLDLSE
jgi:Tol biopolymer transport system component